jgi:hypothetical protein
MDLVYICRDGDNEELRYSIRSAVANLPHDNIWVVGGKPDWYTGNYIRIKQNAMKFDNARNNLNAICRKQEVSPDFVLMNDDFFIVKPIESLESYHRGLLEDHISLVKTSPAYKQMLVETLDVINYVTTGPIYSYELHIPMVMNRNKLAKVLRFPALWRSLYGNMYNVGGTEHKDVKVFSGTTLEEMTSDLPFLSSNDETFNDIIGLLQEMFPNPSKYELHP